MIGTPGGRAEAGARSPRGAVPGRVGILGGTFDPIHVGHLALAEEAREALGLERVLFIPAGDPWQKAGDGVSPIADRLAMVGLAIAGNAAFELSAIEAARSRPTFTADTVEALADLERRAGREPDLWFILSTETFVSLPTWHEPTRLLAACRLVVAPRPGWAPPAEGWLERSFPGFGDRATFLDGPLIDVSATDLRGRVRAGRSIRYLVPDAVAAYIGDHGLYIDSDRRDHPS